MTTTHTFGVVHGLFKNLTVVTDGAQILCSGGHQMADKTDVRHHTRDGK